MLGVWLKWILVSAFLFSFWISTNHVYPPMVERKRNLDDPGHSCCKRIKFEKPKVLKICVITPRQYFERSKSFGQFIKSENICNMHNKRNILLQVVNSIETQKKELRKM